MQLLFIQFICRNQANEIDDKNDIALEGILSLLLSKRLLVFRKKYVEEDMLNVQKQECNEKVNI